MKFTLNVNTVSQMLLLALQLVNQIQPLVAPKWQAYGVTAVGVIQAVLAVLAHYKNPDGTPAAVAYLSGK